MTKQLVRMRLADIIPYENNPRHNDNAVEAVKESIRQCEYIAPIIVDEDSIILAGHTRAKALAELGKASADVMVVSGLTDEQKRKYRLLDNKTNELATWDIDKLEIELEDIDFEGFDFGFDVEIEELPPEVVEDEVPETAPPRCKLGDLWQLGGHRLICGDSTDPAVIDRLMDGVKADMVFTDPPYNVAMQRSGTIQNDDLSQEDFENLLDGAFINAISNCATQNMYWWIGFRQYSTLEKVFNMHNVDVRNCIVWDKGSIGLGKKGFRYQHELCIFSGEINNNSASDVWKFDRSTEGIHPTMKPIALVANAIQNIDNVESVLDLFGGSGSTLIACEQLNRKCYMCELDERYCDVIIERWEKFTGQKAVLLNG